MRSGIAAQSEPAAQGIWELSLVSYDVHCTAVSTLRFSTGLQGGGGGVGCRFGLRETWFDLREGCAKLF